MCLNCSVSNSEYNATSNNPNIIYTFKSGIEAAEFTKVPKGNVAHSCKNAKPMNGLGRWLFSDVSIKDLTLVEIRGLCNRPFMLINKITKQQSPIFNKVTEPQKQGYKVNQGSLSQCLLGKLKTVNGYYVTLVI